MASTIQFSVTSKGRGTEEISINKPEIDTQYYVIKREVSANLTAVTALGVTVHGINTCHDHYRNEEVGQKTLRNDSRAECKESHWVRKP